jgi:acetoin utilization deacetylase AcuC-like enzyme
MEYLVVPAVDRFKPQMLLISAGFDAHRDDPLAHMEVSDEGFERITRQLVAVAEQHCGGRIVSMLEGGYNLAALGRGVVRHLVGMGDET